MSADIAIVRLPSGRTPNPYREQYLTWRGAAPGEGDPQHPVDELLGEHHFLRLVLVSMQTEAVALSTKKAMNLDYWDGAVDIIGNFGLLLHWRKKANHLFPAIRTLGFDDKIDALDREQQGDIETTLELVDAVQEGDNEKVVRLVSLYTGSKRRHLEREEDSVLLPARDALEIAAVDRIRAEFENCDRRALPGANRAHYLGVADELLGNLAPESVSASRRM